MVISLSSIAVSFKLWNGHILVEYCGLVNVEE